jgi:Flp pilus assembly pilin Flp
MKQPILLFALLCATTFTQAQIGIGTGSPNAASQLEVSSTSKGFLPPRMTALQRNAISTPVAGLMVWCNDCGSKGEIQIYNGTEWVNFIGGARQLTAAATSTKLGSDINGEAAYSFFGVSVSVSSDGTTLAIGASGVSVGGVTEVGQVSVYKNIAGTWTKIGTSINGEAAFDFSGFSVSISSDGTKVAIGAAGNNGGGVGYSTGHVRVYENIGGTWTKIGADIDGEAAGDQSGNSVAISSDGTSVAIGALNNDGSGSNAGQVRVYKNIAGTWTKIGADIDGEAADDQSGNAVAISSDGTTVAIGATGNDGVGSNAGQVRVYQYSNSNWTKIGADIDGEAIGDKSGKSVAISADGTIVAIGADLNDGSGAEAGQVRVYQNIAGTWTKIGADIDGEAAGDFSGASVAISSDGNTVAIGAPYNDGSGADAGQVRVYKNIAGTWTKIVADIDGEAASDLSGGSVAISSDGTVVAIGARNNKDGGGDYAGQVRVYKNIGF